MTEVPEPERRKTVSDEIRLLYSTAVAEIAGFKQQQWQVTNYGLLLDAAIVSIPRLHANISPCVLFVLATAAVGVGIAGWVLIGMFDSSIHIRRERLTFIRKTYMTEEFRDAWRSGKSADQMPDMPEEKVRLRPLFRGLFVAGLVATLSLLWATHAAA